jgi:hypothetical protein
MKTFTVFAFIATLTTSSSATTTAATDSPFKLGTPTYFGSGCPKDSVAIITATDGQSVSVLFSGFGASTTSTLARDRKSCNLAVPVDVKPGIAVGVVKVDYRGNAYVPKGSGDAYAQFDAEYYFAGQKGPVVTRKYYPGYNDNVLITNEVPVGAVVWSPCGASTNFRINSAVIAYKGTMSKEDAQIAIDSVDATVQEGFRYYLTTRRC